MVGRGVAGGAWASQRAPQLTRAGRRTRALKPAAAAGGRGRPAPYSLVMGDARGLPRQGGTNKSIKIKIYTKKRLAIRSHERKPSSPDSKLPMALVWFHAAIRL